MQKSSSLPLFIGETGEIPLLSGKRLQFAT